jgi:hypothetical protein
MTVDAVLEYAGAESLRRLREEEKEQIFSALGNRLSITEMGRISQALSCDAPSSHVTKTG